MINLKSLNRYVVTNRFKMESIRTVAKSVDAEGRLASQARLKGCISHCPHTLFTPKISEVPVAGSDMGIQSPPICSAPYIHILKLMKPEVSTLWKLGFRLIVYLDDNGKKQGGSKKTPSHSNGATGASKGT